MSQDDESYDSPLTTALTEVMHDESDALTLDPNLPKRNLREVALCRLCELRKAITALQTDKERGLKQIEELMSLVTTQQQATNSTGASEPTGTPTVHQPLDKTHPTKAGVPDKFNGVDKSPTISNWLFRMKLYLKVTGT